MNGSPLTHRMVRYAHRIYRGTVLDDGHEPARYSTESWEVTCACGDVFAKDTELLASAAYLAHLPQPAKQAQ